MDTSDSSDDDDDVTFDPDEVYEDLEVGQSLEWTSKDVNLIDKIRKRVPRSKFISSDEFIDILFDLPGKDVNNLLRLPQEEMFKRIFCYWKYLSTPPSPPPPRPIATKQNRKKIKRSQLTMTKEMAPGETKSNPSGGGHGDSQFEDHPSGDGLKRRCKSQVEILKIGDILEPRPGGSQGHYESDLEKLSTVICHESPGDVVPFRNPSPAWRLSSLWTWAQELLAVRRSRRVIPI